MTGTSAAQAVARRRRPLGALTPWLQRVRSHPGLSALALAEAYREAAGGHRVDRDHRPHLDAAIGWLEAAQDAAADGGLARGYSLTWNRMFRSRGWQPSYPETTGYTIPTLYNAARLLGRPDLAARATRAAEWEVSIQLPDGAVQAGVIGARAAPAVFNTGQVMLGWLAAFRETGRGRFADTLRRAGQYLAAILGPDGLWHQDQSPYARQDATLYNTQTAWALVEAGVALGEPTFVTAAEWNLRAVLRLQKPNGWFPHCCLNDPDRPLLHTVAYAIRGLLEGGRVLGDHTVIERAATAARALAERVRDDGWMPGRVAGNWSPTATWSCLTGNAQMANVWLRLYVLTGDASWLEPVPQVLRFLKATQNRSSACRGLRGGIKGSWPIGAEYGRYEVLSWATKFFVDALLRHDTLRTGRAGAAIETLA